jgi:hypothetical protein
MEVFRFIAYRPPEPSRTPAVDTAEARSYFQEALGRAVDDARPLDAVQRHATEYLRTEDFVDSLRDLDIPLESFGKELDARQVHDLNALYQTVRDVFEAKTDNQQSRESQTKNVPIPDGYRAKSARVTVALAPRQLKYERDRNVPPIDVVNIPSYDSWEYVAVAVGREGVMYFNPHLGWTETVDLSWQEDYRAQGQTGELGLLIEATWDTNWAVSIEIRFERTEEGITEWRYRTYDAIMQRYFELKTEYEEQLAVREGRQGIAIAGSNPELSRAIEKGELKRGALTLLTEAWHPQLADFGSIRKTGFPEVDFGKARDEAEEIQFLEQAFEWPYMMYSLYPYYWADQPSWPGLAQIEDTDPLHAEFLQAGAARVVVPVRPGYET